MLAIRMQRTGRKKHAMYRVVVQNSRVTPTSGKVIAQLGSYDPHTKVAVLQKDKASFYLEHGAQPSDRVVLLLQKEGIKLPKWVTPPTKKQGATRNPDKLGKAEAEAPAAADETVAEAPAEEAAVAETPAEEPASEAPAAEAAVEEALAEETTPEAEPAEAAEETDEKS